MDRIELSYGSIRNMADAILGPRVGHADKMYQFSVSELVLEVLKERGISYRIIGSEQPVLEDPVQLRLPLVIL